MEKNPRKIENREWIVFSLKKKENKSGHRTAVVRTWRRQRRTTRHVTSTLDGLCVNVDNLTFVEEVVLQGELSLIEAFLPKLLTSLVNTQE